MTRSDCALNLKTLFTVLQALMNSCIQFSGQASSITISPSSAVRASSAVQDNTTVSSVSLYESQTATFTPNIFSSALQNSSVSSGAKTSLILRYSTSVAVTETTSLSTTTTSIRKFISTSTPLTPTPTTVLVVTGLPHGKVITAIAGVLGAILLILLGVIIWNLCLVPTFERRPLSRVEPSDMSRRIESQC